MNHTIVARSPVRGTRLRWLRIAAGAAALAVSLPAAGQIYKCVDSAGRVTYQQAPCPAGSKGGRVEVTVDNGGGRGSGDDEAQWEAAAQQHTVIEGMPKRFVQKSLGAAGEIRPGRPGENAAEIWAYPRESDTLRIGFTSGAVVWQRSDSGATDLSPVERTRIAARASIARGQSCGQMVYDLGNADREESVPMGAGAAARRYVWDPASGDDKTRTTVLCVNGVVQEIDRQAM